MTAPDSSKMWYAPMADPSRYLALGDLIEKVSGQPYVQYVREQLLAPLRLRDGAVIGFDIPRPDAHAHGMLHRFGWLNLVLGLVVDRDRLTEDSA